MVAPHRSAISWTDYSGGDANFVTGCTPVSEGCRNCYARAIYERFGRDFGTVNGGDGAFPKFSRLLNWNLKRDALRRGDGSRPMVFVCDTGDILHEDVSRSVLFTAFEIMDRRDDIDWQVLTKRADRLPLAVEAYRFWHGGEGELALPPNIWLGVSVENQARADERIPLLLEVPAAVRFVSVEPMLEPVELSPWLHELDWVICGAESGPNRRPFDVQWALDLYRQCREAGVAFFYKQGSALRPGCNAHLPGYGVVQEWPRV